MTLRWQALNNARDGSEPIDMGQHTLQISHIGVPTTHIPEVTRMGLLILITIIINNITHTNSYNLKKS